MTYTGPEEAPVWLKISSEVWGLLLQIIFPWINYAAQWKKATLSIQASDWNNNTIQMYGFAQFSNNIARSPLSAEFEKPGSAKVMAWNADQPGLVLFVLSFVSLIIFMGLAWYLNQVLKTEEGFALPWNFFITKYYWTGKSTVSQENFGDTVEEERLMSANTQSVRIHKMTKVYKSTTAVKEMTLAMVGCNLIKEKGNLYSILGHNGSGKTSTINCLSGVTNHTYGAAFIFGYDVKTEINAIRSRMGVCSQFDLLYPTLTGAQHVEFYARFRGVRLEGKSMSEYIADRLSLVELSEAGQRAVGGYSGGMKRRLSVALSTVGNDLEIIFLDGILT